MDEGSHNADPLINRVMASLRGPVRVGDMGVDQALAQLRREARLRRWARGGAAAALAASLVVAIGLGWRGRAHPGAEVRFELADPAASQVALVGDFNDWKPRAKLRDDGAGHWSVTLRLKPGRYRYAFVVEGSSWRADPSEPSADDEFGTPTSVITVVN